MYAQADEKEEEHIFRQLLLSCPLLGRGKKSPGQTSEFSSRPPAQAKSRVKTPAAEEERVDLGSQVNGREVAKTQTASGSMERAES